MLLWHEKMDIAHTANVIEQLFMEEEEVYNLIKISVEITGDAVLDTGATRSIISQDLAYRLNISYSENNEKVRKTKCRKTRTQELILSFR